MRYLGNKQKLLDFINKPLIDHDIHSGTFCDIFAGTTSVSQFFKKLGYTVISNDIMYYSYVFQKACIENNDISPKFPGLEFKDIYDTIHYLNNLSGVKGFMYNNFSRGGSERNYFSIYNAQKIDAIREQIELWYINKQITVLEYYVLLTSLLLEVSKVSNTTGTYSAYLKSIDPRANKPIRLTTPVLLNNNKDNTCYNMDGIDLVKQIKPDVLYIDPPYNHRQYATNYHVLETISVWDKNISNTKTGLRDSTNQRSDFCSKNKCYTAFNDLIINADCKYIMVSYSSEGIMSSDDIMSVLSNIGKPIKYQKLYKRFKSHNAKYNNNNLYEWLFFVKVVK